MTNYFYMLGGANIFIFSKKISKKISLKIYKHEPQFRITIFTLGLLVTTYPDLKTTKLTGLTLQFEQI
jgi:hypothetical protein